MEVLKKLKDDEFKKICLCINEGKIDEDGIVRCVACRSDKLTCPRCNSYEEFSFGQRYNDQFEFVCESCDKEFLMFTL